MRPQQRADGGGAVAARRGLDDMLDMAGKALDAGEPRPGFCRDQPRQRHGVGDVDHPGAALADVESSRNDPVPLHLRNAPTKLMKNLGYGEGYRYAHRDYVGMETTGDLPPAVALQSNLPEALADRTYFEPGNQGDEARLRAWIDERRRTALGAESELFDDA